jgi:hypothetical protein
MTAEATLQAVPEATLHAVGRYGDLGLSGLEIAAAQPYGADPAPPLPEPSGSPREALEAVILDALRSPPCVVAFSGGRDSSALLATATSVARREALPLPVAASHRFPGVATADERDWQEMVVRHIGIEDWEVLDCGDDLDVVGPIASAALARHGPMSAPNAHFQIPLAEVARGGTLLTGLDGDSVLGGWRWSRLAAVLRGRVRPRARDAVTAAHYASPLALQRRIVSRIDPLPTPWLTSDALAQIADVRVRERVVQPRRFDAYVEWLRRRRILVCIRRQLDLLGTDVGARIAHPLLDDRFLASYAHDGRRWGPGDRTTTMRALFADVLPEALLGRRSKATFDEVFIGRHARELIARWDGEGFDPGLVRADALRDTWARPDIPFRTTPLMQWLRLRELNAA